MDNFRLICYWAFFALIVTPTSAQHLHLSNYDHSPMIISPALSGAYKGSLRIGGSYREQFRSFLVEPYETTTINVDMPLAMRLPEGQWVGMGLQLGNTSAGDLALTMSSIAANVAYHRQLGKRKSTTIGIGIQYSMSMLQIDHAASAHFEDELLGSVDMSLDRGLLENLSTGGQGLSAGLYFQNRYSKKLSFRIGLAYNNIWRQEQNMSSEHHSFSRQFTAHLDWNYQLNKKWMVHPKVLLQQLPFSRNIVSAMGTSYRMKEKLILKTRIGHRWKDAMIMSAGADFGPYSVLLTFDMTTSTAAAYNGSQGAMEIGVSRIFTWHPPVKEKVIYICPRL